MKNNYGPAGAAVVLRWQDGVFAPAPRLGSLDQIAADYKADELFMTLLRRFDTEGRTVSDKASALRAGRVREGGRGPARLKWRARRCDDAPVRRGSIKVISQGRRRVDDLRLVEVER